MIVDAKRHILARRPPKEGAGVVLADIALPEEASAVDPIPDDFGIPPEIHEPWMSSWERWLKSGAHNYRVVTLAYLRTG
ncbi:MAG: hypothetical protein GC183_04060 [Thiobacillus sp.]|nr:hypothetical protein [Thiobacillus sp.]